MKTIPYAALINLEDILYLRKSRSDNPNESVEEVLAKHETMIQDLAEKELGHRIPEECIIREVVSGETIDERPGMVELLSRIENPAVKRVWVVEPQRLSRGDLMDCGRVVNALRYTSTKIRTLQMEYDLSNKMQRKFFEQELMRGNDYLEYTKEILLRGRILAVQKKGAYIMNTPPFGYDKAIIDGIHSLKPNENADAVRLIFDKFVNEGWTCLQIGRHLDSIGIKPLKSKIWEKSSIRTILSNIHYAGFVKFGTHHTERVYESGEVKKKSLRSAPEDVIIAPGKHEAIIDKDLFDAAQEIFKKNKNPRVGWNAPLQNPLAGMIFCSKCGRAMVQHPYTNARTRIECNGRSYGCDARSTFLDDVVEAVVAALEMEHLPELEARLKNNDGLSFEIQKRQLQKMRAELDEMKKQETKQFELLEKGIYSEDLFMERNKALHAEMEALKSRIFEAGKTLPKDVDYGKKIVTLKDAIAGVRDPSISIEAKNKLLRAIVNRIDYEFISRESHGNMKYKLHISLLI